MFIKFLEMRRLVTFQCAQISELSVVYTDPVQVILGTNGSGKSNLLRQLSPLPPVRSDFLDGGYKRLIIEHDDQTFTITSDFSRKDSPHSFILNDGDELNDGGTTDVQKELVIKYLGWTPEVQALCTNSYVFTKMGPGQREALFMKLNPDKIEFVIEKNKKVKSAIRNCKAVLNKLVERKALLEGRMISEELLDERRKQSEAILAENTEVTKIIIKIDTLLNGVSSAPFNEASLHDQLLSIPRKVRIIRNALRKQKEIDRKDPEKQLIQMGETIAVTGNQIAEREASLGEMYQSLRVDTANLEEFVQESVITELLADIHSTQTEFYRCKEMAIAHPFPESLCAEKELVLSQLHEILTFFLGSTIKLRSRKTIRCKTENVNHWMSVKREILELLSRENDRRRTLRESIKIRMEDIPTDRCALNDCPLYRNFKTSYDGVRNELRKLDNSIAYLERKLSRIGLYLEQQTIQLEEHAPYTTKIMALYDLIAQYPSLQPFFKQKDILQRLNNNPIIFHKQVEKHFEHSEATHSLGKLEESLLKKELELAKYRTTAGSEREQLTKLIDDKKMKIAGVEKELKELWQKKHSLESQHSNCAAFIAARNYCDDEMVRLEKAVQGAEKAHDNEKLRRIKQLLVAHQQELTKQLAEITSTLREQEQLHARFQYEIVSVIEDTQKEKAFLEQLNLSLEEVPHDYTVRFLNNVLRKLNAFIAKVFTYELSLDPVPSHKAVSFRFPYVADSTNPPDISQCSTAQEEIINLSFTLALRLVKGLNDYPLYLDEVGKTFDFAHQQKLLDLLMFIMEEHLCSQMFIINHHAVIHEGITNTETLVLSETNIMKTESFNTHAQITKY